MTMKDSIAKLQNLPEGRKKVVFFIVMGIVVLVALFFGIVLTKKNISTIGRSLKQISFPKIDIPEQKFEVPGANNLNLNKLEEAFKNLDLGNVSEGNNGVLQNTSEDNSEIFNKGF